MKKLVSILICICFVGSICAQPAKSRVRNNNAATSKDKKAATVTDRASLMFPTAVKVPEDVAWRRDIYRSLDLKKDENASLYYPVRPQGNDVNLFTLMFRLLSTGTLPAYEYKLDGVEDFSKEYRIHFKDLLDRYDIRYEIEGQKLIVEYSDVPADEVLSFFIKESSYYDQYTATYHTRITALCPVMHRGEYFGEESDVQKSPMFWVKYDDIAPYLSKQMVMTSNLNNAAKMSMDDYFATNQYKGTIYMTTNMQNRALQDYCKTDSALQKEQKRIEKEIVDFERNIWATPVDSAELARKDSIAAASQTKKSSRRIRKTSETASDNKAVETETDNVKESSKEKKEEVKEEKVKTSSAPRVSVRRQRR